MCYLNFPYGYYEPEPSLRAFPRLAWAVPVSITELAASLEAYSNIHPQVHTLRLSHRFGKGPLSRIPQEILEMIVEEAQQLERRRTQPPWKEHFHCFRGICTKGQHYGPYGPHTEETWLELFSNPYDDEDDPLPLDPDDYTEDEKLAMVKAEPDTSYAWDDDLIHELHMTSKEEWLDAVCLCKSTSSSRARNWQQSRLMLASHFGLDMYIIHEIVSPELEIAVGPTLLDEVSHYTSAFLTLDSGASTLPSSSRFRPSTSNQSFVPEGNHVGFRQTLDPSALTLSDEQRKRFVRTMRVLGLAPYYHFTELESLPPPELSSLLKSNIRPSKLEQYFKDKNEELAKQSWPQLQLLATSDVVSPK